MLAMRVRLTIELHFQHRPGVKMVFPSNRRVSELQIQHRPGVKIVFPSNRRVFRASNSALPWGKDGISVE